MSKVNTIPEAVLEKTKLKSIFERLVKRSEDAVIQSVAQHLLNKSSGIGEGKTKEKDNEPVVPAKSAAAAEPKRTTEAVAGVKRSRSSDIASSLVPAKKVASSLSKPSLGPKPPIKVVSSNGRPVTGSSSKQEAKPTSTAGAAGPAPKVKHVIPKTSSLLGSLQSSAKRSMGPVPTPKSVVSDNKNM